MEKITTDSRIASYVELKIQSSLLVSIANTLMRIEAHLCGTPLLVVDEEAITENRKILISNQPSE